MCSVLFLTCRQLLEGLGPPGYGLLVTTSVLVLLLNVFMLAILVRKFLKTVPASQVTHTDKENMQIYSLKTRKKPTECACDVLS